LLAGTIPEITPKQSKSAASIGMDGGLYSYEQYLPWGKIKLLADAKENVPLPTAASMIHDFSTDPFSKHGYVTVRWRKGMRTGNYWSTPH